MEENAQLASLMDGPVQLYFKWTEVQAAFCNLELENQPWQRFLQRSTLCKRTIWYTNRCVANANVCSRGGTRILESAVWQGFISQRRLWVEIRYRSLRWSQHMTSTKWDALSEHTVKTIIPSKSALSDLIFFPAQCHRTDSAVFGYHIRFFSSIDHKWLNARSHHFDSPLKHL